MCPFPWSLIAKSGRGVRQGRGFFPIPFHPQGKGPSTVPPTWGRIPGGKARVSGEEGGGGSTWPLLARNRERLMGKQEGKLWMRMIPQIPPCWRSSNKPLFPADNRWALICPCLGLGLPLLPPLMALPCQWHMSRSHSLGTHCSRSGLARGLWAHMAEGPHIELHPLGKVGVREAG